MMAHPNMLSRQNGKKRDTPALAVHKNGGATHRLFCFPYAGGGASVFRQWSGFLPDVVEVCGVQPPGRENRIGEDPIADVHELVDRLLPSLVPWLDRPFACYGHSTGALVAFEFIRALRRKGMPLPVHLIVSGARAPHIPEPSPLHHLPEEAFIRELNRFSGTPKEVLAHKELMEIYIPILRADLAIEERYAPREELPLAMPITAIYGTKDKEASKAVMAPWEQYTTASFELIGIEGDHFFIKTAAVDFGACLSRIIATF